MVIDPMDSDSATSRLGGDGPPVVLIHGYGADRFTWLTTTPALLNRASVWLLDLPGHGKGDPDCGDGSLSAMVERVGNCLQDAGLDQIHLIGHSLGGRIAMELATRDALQIHSLFLISPAGVGGSINMDFLTRFHEAGDEQQVLELLRMLVHDPRMISRSLGGRVLQYLEQAATRSNLQRIAAGLASAQAELPETLRTLSELGIPCNSAWGLEDRINPPNQDYIRELPGDVHLLEACGHLPHLEHSASVNRLLRDFHSNVLTSE
ncbi:alpha/beta fold hydrolase [Granulosicoccus sp. 3-233]|uniref:alpha/beta fold hydrolase n=1 Tax=Granulosicoccus sp. 3-233 TaxID=3417969 RepID=UPI003D3394F6